jgi:serine/threonine-protein phosphatase 2B catalytic subunit
VSEPAANKPTDEEFFIGDEDGSLKPNTNYLRDHFFHEGRLTEAQALFILKSTTAVLSSEPNMVDVVSPVTSELALRGHHSMLKGADIVTSQYVEIYMVNM